jgi:hypothetical protein
LKASSKPNLFFNKSTLYYRNERIGDVKVKKTKIKKKEKIKEMSCFTLTEE